jgi:hypothetical protein
MRNAVDTRKRISAKAALRKRKNAVSDLWHPLNPAPAKKATKAKK